MKTNIIYSITILFMALMGISCGDKEDTQPDIAGVWNYEKPHFVFDYAQDSISIVMDKGKKTSIAVTDLKNMFLEMATEKMKDYFTGLEFNPGNKLKVKMQMQNGAQGAIGADYIQRNDIIQVTLDTNDLKQMMPQGVAPKIPAISFKYAATPDRMQMYFDKVYVQTLVLTMMDQIVDMLIPIMGMDQMPPTMLEQAKKGIKAQIPPILDNIVRLEIGFFLTRESMLK